MFSKAHRRRLADDKGETALQNFYQQSENLLAGKIAQNIQIITDNTSNGLVSSSSAKNRAYMYTKNGEKLNDDEENPIKASEFCDDPSIMKLSVMESRFVNDEYDDLQNNDDEEDFDDDGIANNVLPPVCSNSITYRFGQGDFFIKIYP